MSAADREEYAAWVDAELGRFREWTGGNGRTWDHAALEAAERRGRGPKDQSESAAYRGPWHTVRPYVTGEFLDWVEGHYQPRKTLQEWQADRIADRRREAMRTLDYVESVDYPLDQLEQLRELLAQRDELIRLAAQRGATKARIGDAIGITRQSVHTVLRSVPPAHNDIASVELVETAPGVYEEAF